MARRYGSLADDDAEEEWNEGEELKRFGLFANGYKLSEFKPQKQFWGLNFFLPKEGL